MFERGTRSGCSAARLARQLRELEVPGSNPGTPTRFKFAYLKHRALASRARAFLFSVFVPAGELGRYVSLVEMPERIGCMRNAGWKVKRGRPPAVEERRPPERALLSGCEREKDGAENGYDKQNAERQRGRVRFFECGRLLFFHNLLFFVDCFLVGACFPSVERGPVGRDAKSEPFCPFPAVCRLLVPACRRAGKDSQPIALRKNVRFFPCGLPFPGCEACVLIERRAASVSNGAMACRRPLLSRIGSQDTLIEE